jgi:3-hydroxyisobutyrate dehydrogenase-like beta-hydroxyacid dehydrogenase
VKVGFVGLGRMGHAMARRALDAGHELMLYDAMPKFDDLVADGAKPAGSVAEAARYGGVVITMLASDEVLLEVVEGPNGLAASLPQGGVHIVMGTHGVAAVKRLVQVHAAAGQTLIAAPVLGRPEAVAAGRLGIIIAGPSAVAQRVRPLFEAIGKRLFEAGEQQTAATAIKTANNFLLGCAMEAMGEAFALVEKSGGERGLFFDVLTEGLFACPAYSIYGKMIADHAYDNVGFTTLLGLKDANLAQAAGENLGVPLPSGNVWRDRLIGAITHGDGERDWAVVALEQARASGLA